MSLILDALNRSESDRDKSGSAPGLHSVHGPQGTDVPPWKRWVWPAVTVLLVLLVLWLWLVRPAPDSAPQQAAGPDPQATPAAEPPPEPKPVAEQRPAPADTPTREAGAQPAVPEPVPDPDPDFDEDIAALYQERLQAQAAPARAAEAAYEQAEPTAPRTAREQPAPAAAGADTFDVDAVAEAAQSALQARQEDDNVVEHAAPFISELRQNVKDQIPSIFYSGHSWSSNPTERSVILNKKLLREGQQVVPGVQLVEILPDSIVLDFRGTEFRLHSLNSWVNL